MSRIPMDLLLTNTPSLSAWLKSQTDQFLAGLIRTNYNTQFAQAASASQLAIFRDVTACGMGHFDDASLCETFRNTVQLTTYEVYAPFIARLQEKPCKQSRVMDLLAPLGLPDYITGSSSTSGGTHKSFPKYGCLSGLPVPPQVPDSSRATANLAPLHYTILDIKDEDDLLVKKVYLASAVSMGIRSSLGLDPEKDDGRMARFVHDYSSPFAARFIQTWRSFLLIEALFAIGNRSLTAMQMTFINIFVEMMRYLDEEFDVMVECIAKGTIPDLDGIAHVRHYLESNIFGDPERAAELRKFGRPSSSPGWCGHVWPKLCSVTAVSSGSFASYVPFARQFLGPNTHILSGSYASSEAWIGLPYNPLELNQFKLRSEVITEFLDTGDSTLQSVLQPWEVEAGKRYEVVLTTSDGLWRYRLGDVVQISGFDPSDGAPIVQFIERRNAVMRFPSVLISEEELRSTMTSVASDFLGNIVDWTTAIDDRQLPPTIGYFVEVADAEARIVDSMSVTERMLVALSELNGKIPITISRGSFRKPTIRFVASGTFSDFRQMKIEEGGSMNQVKVPVVLPKAENVAWFSDRVVKELD